MSKATKNYIVMEYVLSESPKVIRIFDTESEALNYINLAEHSRILSVIEGNVNQPH